MSLSSASSNDSLHLTMADMVKIVGEVEVTTSSSSDVKDAQVLQETQVDRKDETKRGDPFVQRVRCSRCSESDTSNPNVVEADGDKTKVQGDALEEAKTKQKRSSMFSRFLMGRRESRSKSLSLDEEIERMDAEITKTIQKLQDLQLKRLELEELKNPFGS